LGLLALLALGAAAFIFSGAYNIAADEPHWRVTAWLMESVRDRSIAAQSATIVVPELGNESLIRAGAGNYDAMCAGCHLRPDLERSELSVGLYPAPPNLTNHRTDDAARAFWVIKHGIKMSGMPAWGKSMEDKHVWGMVAFMRELPGMSPERYRELVAASGGHQHGEGETGQPENHDDDEMVPARDAGIEDHAKAPPHGH